MGLGCAGRAPTDDALGALHSAEATAIRPAHPPGGVLDGRRRGREEPQVISQQVAETGLLVRQPPA
eukprot:3968648-Lingulodinium_polyedra.AAC.1